MHLSPMSSFQSQLVRSITIRANWAKRASHDSCILILRLTWSTSHGFTVCRPSPRFRSAPDAPAAVLLKGCLRPLRCRDCLEGVHINPLSASGTSSVSPRWSRAIITRFTVDDLDGHPRHDCLSLPPIVSLSSRRLLTLFDMVDICTLAIPSFDP